MCKHSVRETDYITFLGTDLWKEFKRNFSLDPDPEPPNLNVTRHSRNHNTKSFSFMLSPNL